MSDPLVLFVFLGLFSPGPNVILLTTSGARFGLRPTLPHLAGVVLGVGITAGLTGFGLGGLIAAVPGVATVLKIAAALWILYMASHLWKARPKEAEAGARPMTLIEAVLFQWVNPKVWAVALAAASAYPGGYGPLGEALRLGGTFSSVNLAVCLFWTWAGSLLSFLQHSPKAWQLFNRVMALALGSFAVLLFL